MPDHKLHSLNNAAFEIALEGLKVINMFTHSEESNRTKLGLDTKQTVGKGVCSAGAF